MEQRLSLLTLGVRDVGRARTFYEALGWTTRAGPDDDVVFFRSGGTILALWARDRLAEDSAVEDAGGWGSVIALAAALPAAPDAPVEAGGATDAPPPVEGAVVAPELQAVASSPAMMMTAPRRRVRSIKISSSSAGGGLRRGVGSPLPSGARARGNT